MKRTLDRMVHSTAPLPPIAVGARARSDRTRFETWLAVFMRCVAVLWIAEGLLQWADVLMDRSGTLLTNASSLHVAALFFFCVLDLVAAVGLWLVTTWGVAVWIATVAGHLLVLALAPDSLVDPLTILASDVLLVTAYAALAWLAARENRKR